MTIKNNEYVLIILLLATQIIIGCGGSRKGCLVGFGGGLDAVVADEEWTVYRDNGLSGNEHHDTVTTTVSPVGNLKIGWGFTEHALVSTKLQKGTLNTSGIEIAIFQEKKAPSKYFFMSAGGTGYSPDQLPFGNARGIRASAGVGYEFKRNWTVEGDLSYGSIHIEGTEYGALDFLFRLFDGSGGPYVEGHTSALSLGFKINCILY